MGQIFDYFAEQQHTIEADVSQNFIIPLLTEFLGYKKAEILPERMLPSIDIPLNRDKTLAGADARSKPDYLVTIDGDISQIIFTFESKGPKEGFDKHCNQVLAYSIATQVNLILISNGLELRAYNANDLVFQSRDIASLDLQFPELVALLHRDKAHIPSTERLQSINLDIALGKTEIQLKDETTRRIATENSDFHQYLQQLSESTVTLSFPPNIASAFDIELRKIPANQLYRFRQNISSANVSLEPKSLSKFQAIQSKLLVEPMLIIGESGIGKSSLVEQLAHDQTAQCLTRKSSIIPVLVKMADYHGDLLNLILEKLARFQPSMTLSSIRKLLSQKRLLLLFDAFDEIPESFVQRATNEIQSLIRDYQCFIVITTRHNRIPRIEALIRYEVALLNYTQIYSLAEAYLGTSSAKFTNLLFDKGLQKAASNTLLLTLMIMLYKRTQTLPSSRMRIVDEVVEVLKGWNQVRIGQPNINLNWETQLHILSILANTSFHKGSSYTLEKSVADPLVVELLDKLKSQHDISPATLKVDVYSELELSGLLAMQDGQLSFWHRIFQEYLAARHAAFLINAEGLTLEDEVKKSKWAYLLPYAAFWVENKSDFVSRLVSLNVFTAGKAVIECGLNDKSVLIELVDCLVQKCRSSNRLIRQTALDILVQLEGSYVGETFRNLFNASDKDAYAEHVRKTALYECARRKISGARDLVYSQLDWRSYTDFYWRNSEVHAGSAIIKALGEFDNAESQRIILERWKTIQDIYTRDHCRSSLIQIAHRNALTQETKSALIAQLQSKPKQSSHNTNIVPTAKDRTDEVPPDYLGIEDVLAACLDQQLAETLIKIIKTANNNITSFHCQRILSQNRDQAIFDRLLEELQNTDNFGSARLHFLIALVESNTPLPYSLVEELISNPLPTMGKAYGVLALKHFTFEKAKPLLLKAIGLPTEDLVREHQITYLNEYILDEFDQADVFQRLQQFINEAALSDDSRNWFQERLDNASSLQDLLDRFSSTPHPPSDADFPFYQSLDNIIGRSLGERLGRLLFPWPYSFMLHGDGLCYPLVHENIMKVLAELGQMSLIIHEQVVLPYLDEEMVDYLGNDCRRVFTPIFYAISTQRHFELEGFVRQFVKANLGFQDSRHIRMVIRASFTLADLGDPDYAQEICNQIWTSTNHKHSGGDSIALEILEGIHKLNEQFALEMIEKIWHITIDRNYSLAARECMEALFRIGSPQALEALIERSAQPKNRNEYNHHASTALRIIRDFAPTDKEDWLINRLETAPSHDNKTQVIEMLGNFGSEKALPLLHKLYADGKGEPMKHTAFWSIHQINHRLGRVWYDNEEQGCSNRHV